MSNTEDYDTSESRWNLYIRYSLLRAFCQTLMIHSPSLSYGLEFDYFHIQPNTAIVNTLIIGTEFAVDPTHCALFCQAVYSSCLSASYDEVNMVCKLAVYHLNDSDDNLIPQTNWMTLTPNGCTEDWVRIGQACYYFREENSLQYQARHFCQNIGGKLAEPETNACFQLLRNYLVAQNNGKRYWIGLTVLENGGNFTYVWQSNYTTVQYTAWGADQPRHRVSGDTCAVVQGDYLWSIARCRINGKAICQN